MLIHQISPRIIHHNMWPTAREVRSDDSSDEEEEAIERLKNTLGVTCDANSIRTADSDKENTQLDHVGDDMYGLGV